MKKAASHWSWLLILALLCSCCTPALAEQSDTDPLRRIDSEWIGANLMQEMRFYQDMLLVYGSSVSESGSFGLRMGLIDPADGSLQNEVFIEDLDLPGVQVCGDLIAVSDWGDGDILLLDETLGIVARHHIDSSYCSIYLSPDASLAYRFTQSEGVQVIDLADGTHTTLLTDTTDLFPSAACGTSITVCYLDLKSGFSTYSVIDLADGSVSPLPFEGGFFSLTRSDDLYLAGVLGEDSVYYFGKAGRPNRMQMSGQYPLVSLLSDPARILISEYDQSGNSLMKLYAADGTFLSSCTIEGGSLFYDPLWSAAQGGYFFTVTSPEGKDELFFWDISLPVSGEGLTFTPVYESKVEGSVVSAALYDRAEQIGSAYGVKVCIAEMIETEFADFSASPEYDEACISDALDTLEKVLAAYPDGFMQQLLYGTQRSIEFHLCASLTSKDPLEEGEQGFDSFVGFTSSLENKSVAAIDIVHPGSLEQTMHHEIMHLIEGKLIFASRLKDDPVFSEEVWNSLNPDGFTYPESYTGLSDSFYSDGYEAWFIDLYSRTFAKEDRARIMEYAMLGSDWAFSSSEGRLEKLRYLCACIRDCFDTSEWTEETVWEAALHRSEK